MEIWKSFPALVAGSISAIIIFEGLLLPLLNTIRPFTPRSVEIPVVQQRWIIMAYDVFWYAVVCVITFWLAVVVVQNTLPSNFFYIGLVVNLFWNLFCTVY